MTGTAASSPVFVATHDNGGLDEPYESILIKIKLNDGRGWLSRVVLVAEVPRGRRGTPRGLTEVAGCPWSGPWRMGWRRDGRVAGGGGGGAAAGDQAGHAVLVCEPGGAAAA